MVNCFLLYEESVTKYTTKTNVDVNKNELRKIIIATSLREALIKLLLTFKQPFDFFETNFINIIKKAWNQCFHEHNLTIKEIATFLRKMSQQEFKNFEEILKTTAESYFIDMRTRYCYSYRFEEYQDLYKIPGLIIR